MDLDCDGLNTWQEWRCRTCPTNACSVLRVLSVIPGPNSVSVSWQSVAGVSYFVEGSANLALPPFTPVASNVPGQPEITSYTLSNAPGMGPYFYRVGVGD